jgi:peptidoglycan/LPS O-acetylase OafA/YrhL
MTAKMYLPHIDGMRGVAIISVMTYHFFPGFLKSGFVGVDIFFVISGFLITSIIKHDILVGNFSYFSFYSKRIKRIFPALIVVLFFSLIFGSIFQLSFEFEKLGKHILGATAMSSNIVLWNESGYFDIESSGKPLLHLWSLGVEEQFYIIWPILLVAIIKASNKKKLFIVFLVALSFSLNIMSVQDNPNSVFYLPIYRFWEIGVGGILALYNFEKFSNKGCNFFGNLLSFVGVLLVLLSTMLIDKSSNFPGYWAAIPVIGMSVIVITRKSWISQNILSNSLIVWVGLISYPLYLWHWPLKYVSDVINIGVIDVNEVRYIKFIAITLSFVMGYVTYRFIEKPIRAPLNNNRFTAKILILIMLFIAFLGGLVLHFEGASILSVKNRSLMTNNILNTKWINSYDGECVNDIGLNSVNIDKAHIFCLKGDKQVDIAIIGDSMANSLYPGMSKISDKEGYSVLNVGSATCAPISNLIGKVPHNKACKQINNKIKEYLINSSISTLIISFAPWDLTNEGYKIKGIKNNKDLINAAINQLVSDINLYEAHGKNIVVVYNWTLIDFNAIECIRNEDLCRVPLKKDSLLENTTRLINESISLNTNACIFDPRKVFIKNGKFNLMDISSNLLIRDTHHLSFSGSDVVASKINSYCDINAK